MYVRDQISLGNLLVAASNYCVDDGFYLQIRLGILKIPRFIIAQVLPLVFSCTQDMYWPFSAIQKYITDGKDVYISALWLINFIETRNNRLYINLALSFSCDILFLLIFLVIIYLSLDFDWDFNDEQAFKSVEWR